ncbi:hypothetical protein AGLY_004625 [Aphis glycines]|uniref:Uncharacterized protein n=1 Tax=Aphis glycines TaxID=307491 RepID=A0A6G0TWT3_APHGL|nr:hypothetical protein AGLY_004625 [Aphis glycines]
MTIMSENILLNTSKETKQNDKSGQPLSCAVSVKCISSLKHRFWAVVLNDDNGCLTTFYTPFDIRSTSNPDHIITKKTIRQTCYQPKTQKKTTSTGQCNAVVTQVDHDTRSHQFELGSVQKIFCRIFCNLSPQFSFWLPTLLPTRPTPLGVKSTHMNTKIYKFNYKLVLVTAEDPSTNFVLNNILALLNIPSLGDTTINCDCLKCCFNIFPIGTGLKSNIAKTKDSATRERCPPLSSSKLSFHSPLNATRISNPVVISSSAICFCSSGNLLSISLNFSFAANDPLFILVISEESSARLTSLVEISSLFFFFIIFCFVFFLFFPKYFFSLFLHHLAAFLEYSQHFTFYFPTLLSANLVSKICRSLSCATFSGKLCMACKLLSIFSYSAFFAWSSNEISSCFDIDCKISL